jgi:hypothetical protein
MKRMPFERPTEHYEEKISSIDEQLCALLKKRREISNKNPGFPPSEYISSWARKFELHEDLLNSLFGTLMNEEEFRPRVEPKGFIGHLPIVKSVEKDEYFYSITSILQYENASVVHFYIDWDPTKEEQTGIHHHSFFELYIEDQYDCRMNGGGGSTGHYSYNFIVSPPLPDKISNLDFVFKEYETPFKEKPTGLEIIM